MHPQALVFTGDLADLGEPDAYERLKALVEPAAQRMGAQLIWVMGNHDERPEYSRILFGEESDAPQDRVYDVNGLRIISFDTTVPGYHHGEVTDDQLDWLADVLASPAPHGSLLAIHHPPIPDPDARGDGHARAAGPAQAGGGGARQRPARHPRGAPALRHAQHVRRHPRVRRIGDLLHAQPHRPGSSALRASTSASRSTSCTSTRSRSCTRRCRSATPMEVTGFPIEAWTQIEAMTPEERREAFSSKTSTFGQAKPRALEASPLGALARPATEAVRDHGPVELTTAVAEFAELPRRGPRVQRAHREVVPQRPRAARHVRERARRDVTGGCRPRAAAGLAVASIPGRALESDPRASRCGGARPHGVVRPHRDDASRRRHPAQGAEDRPPPAARAHPGAGGRHPRHSVQARADTGDAVAVRDLAIIELLYASALRVSELTGLAVRDVDLGRLTVRVLGKGAKERVVPFGVPAKARPRALPRPAARHELGRRHRRGVRRRPRWPDELAGGVRAGLGHPLDGAGYPVRPVRTRSGTPPRRTCSTAAPTSAPCRSCSATRASARPSCTRTSPRERLKESYRMAHPRA